MGLRMTRSARGNSLVQLGFDGDIFDGDIFDGDIFDGDIFKTRFLT
jgi:hypothetical protein